MNEGVAQIRQRGDSKFLYLFVALLVLVALYPLFESEAARAAFVGPATFLTITAGVYACSDKRAVLVTAILLGVPGALGSIDALAGLDLLPGERVGLASSLLFFGFATAVIIKRVLSGTEVNADALYGATCAYLLLGLTWGLAYALVENVQPGSFQFTGGPAAAVVWGPFDFLYFSFATLTTLGYGDITPLTSRARSLASLEAVAGVLYVALLVARLVGMYAGRSISRTGDTLALRGGRRPVRRSVPQDVRGLVAGGTGLNTPIGHPSRVEIRTMRVNSESGLGAVAPQTGRFLMAASASLESHSGRLAVSKKPVGLSIVVGPASSAADPYREADPIVAVTAERLGRVAVGTHGLSGEGFGAVP